MTTAQINNTNFIGLVFMKNAKTQQFRFLNKSGFFDECNAVMPEGEKHWGCQLKTFQLAHVRHLTAATAAIRACAFVHA